MRLFFFYDFNFKPLRDNMVASLQDSGNNDLVIEEDFIQDLGVMQNRAGGGVPTYLYKATKIREAFDKVADGEVFIFSDVDVQFLAPVTDVIEASVAGGADLVLQSEFEDIGVNIGFMAMRCSQANKDFWDEVRAEIGKTGGLDQRVVNNLLYSGDAAGRFGLSWDRFPPRVWCSSQAHSGIMPEGAVVHHANFTIERSKAFDPSIKLSQMSLVRDALRPEGDREPLARFLADVAADATMRDYRDRHFGARRPGREWATLPEGHIARPGGFKEKRKGGAGAGAAAAPAGADAPSGPPVGAAPTEAAPAT